MKKKPDVLVLNKNFVAIHIIDWKKAMSLIVQEAARALDHDYISYELNDWFALSELNDSFPYVTTVNRKIALPEIILLRKYDRLPIRDVKYSRQTLFQRDKFQCAYCGNIFDRKKLTVDHITPKSKGGGTVWANTITCCFICNGLKADRTPQQANMHLLFKPRKPTWLGPLSDMKPEHMLKSWKKFTYRTLVE